MVVPPWHDATTKFQKLSTRPPINGVAKLKRCFSYEGCHNLSPGLATKAKACKGVSQRGSPGVTSHAHGSVGECEGMNPHTPKQAPILGVEVLMDSQIFREQLKKTKPIKLKSSLERS
jgi:hypothetical protein